MGVLKVILIIVGVLVAIVAFIVIAVVIKIRSFASKVKRAVLVHEALSSGLSHAEAAAKLGMKESKVAEIAQYLRDNPRAMAAVEVIIQAKKESERADNGGNGVVIDATATEVVEPATPLLEDHTAAAEKASTDLTPPPGSPTGDGSTKQDPPATN